MTPLTTEKLSDTIGARILGVDRERLLTDDQLPEQVLTELERNGVLVLPELHVDDATQVEFSRRLGRVETFPFDPVHPEIFRVTLDPSRNPSAAYLRGTFAWHIDGLTEDVPISATILTAHAVAESGGETEFASTYQAYDDLSEAEKADFESVRVVHTFERSQLMHHPNPTPEELERWRRRPPQEHPLIWTHRSGRRSLVLGATAASVVGMDEDEGRSFLDDLLARATATERVYRHDWKVGDMVIWDNTGVLHRACPYDATPARDMHRTTLFGTERVQ